MQGGWEAPKPRAAGDRGWGLQCITTAAARDKTIWDETVHPRSLKRTGGGLCNSYLPCLLPWPPCEQAASSASSHRGASLLYVRPAMAQWARTLDGPCPSSSRGERASGPRCIKNLPFVPQTPLLSQALHLHRTIAPTLLRLHPTARPPLAAASNTPVCRLTLCRHAFPTSPHPPLSGQRLPSRPQPACARSPE